jgi:hypothetical protein
MGLQEHRPSQGTTGAVEVTVTPCSAQGLGAAAAGEAPSTSPWSSEGPGQRRTQARRRALGLLLIVTFLVTGCRGETITLPGFECPQPAPATDIAGVWRGQLSTRDLVITLEPQCVFFAFQTFWTVTGTWTWGSGSTGVATFLLQDIHLKGNTGENVFRGATITINESAPFGSRISGVVTGELPGESASNAAWVAFERVPIVLDRR